MSYTYPYPRLSLTVDAVVFKIIDSKKFILLIQRKNEPFLGKWALPGGFVDMDETLETAVSRELEEETGLKNIDLKQLHAFSELNRDPRGRTVSVVFWGIIKNEATPVSGDDAADARWFETDNLPELAFDHDEVVKMALKKLKGE
ncbi:MAG TPA: NUDIX hydrolase [Bacteroidales bacterium]